MSLVTIRGTYWTEALNSKHAFRRKGWTFLLAKFAPFVCRNDKRLWLPCFQWEVPYFAFQNRNVLVIVKTEIRIVTRRLKKIGKYKLGEALEVANECDLRYDWQPSSQLAVERHRYYLHLVLAEARFCSGGTQPH